MEAKACSWQLIFSPGGKLLPPRAAGGKSMISKGLKLFAAVEHGIKRKWRASVESKATQFKNLYRESLEGWWGKFWIGVELLNLEKIKEIWNAALQLLFLTFLVKRKQSTAVEVFLCCLQSNFPTFASSNWGRESIDNEFHYTISSCWWFASRFPSLCCKWHWKRIKRLLNVARYFVALIAEFSRMCELHIFTFSLPSSRTARLN